MPSSRASAIARKPASGVRRSCETQATSWRRDRSIRRSRSRDSRSLPAVAVSSRDSAASSAAIGPAGALNPVSSWPSDRAACRSARLPASTCRPSSQENPNATRPATAHTIPTTRRSCGEMNIALAVPSVPATTARTAMALAAWSDRRSDARRSSQAAPTPERAHRAGAARGDQDDLCLRAHRGSVSQR